MEVRVIKPYTDKELGKNMSVGMEFETSGNRGKILIDKDFVVEVKKEITEEKPKQTRKRKTK